MPAPSRPTVGFIRHNFLPPSETFIYTSMNALAAGDFDVSAFALRRQSESKFPTENVTSLDAVAWGTWNAALYRATTWSPRFFAWARSVQLLHAHMGYTGVHGLYAARKLGKPLVTSFYGHDVTLFASWKKLDPTYWHYALRRTQLFARGDRFCVLSKHMSDALAAQGCPAEKLRVVRLGVDLSRFDGAQKSHAAGAATVLMVGREVDKKGFDDGLRACAAARDRGAELRVVLLGTGDAGLPALQALAAELKLDVAWPDPATRVAAAMKEADILLVPSRTAKNGDQEGTPTVICEGSAAGLPIVSTRHAGIPEQVAHESTGLLADERDVDTLAAHLVRLAASPSERAAMGAAGRAKMQAEYSIAAHVRDLSAVYRELL
jgi:colanic acid/amylovoran biosynthesis glycosyltransferase